MSAKQSTVAKLPISLGDMGFAPASGGRPDCPNTGAAQQQAQSAPFYFKTDLVGWQCDDEVSLRWFSVSGDGGRPHTN